MTFLLAIPIVFLLWHSLYLLAEKYSDKLPFWLKLYVLFVAAYVFMAPASVTYSILENLNVGNGTNAWISLITGSVMFLIFITRAPKGKKRNPFE
jgi:hypothetical protein